MFTFENKKIGMKNVGKIILSILIISAVGYRLLTANEKQEIKKPKNIILLIGDGMGLSEVSASYFFKDSTPNFDRFTTIGLIKTSAADALVCDSAASATAFATGVATYNGAIAVDMQKKPVHDSCTGFFIHFSGYDLVNFLLKRSIVLSLTSQKTDPI